MKQIILILFATVGPGLAKMAAQVREKNSLNSSWQFVLNDRQEISSLQENPRFQLVNIPHTWNDKDILDETPGYHQGIGWYQRSLFIGDEKKGKHLELYFEGACNKTTVFVNGQKAGEHYGGFTGFAVDISPYIKAGETNLLQVRVDNGKYLSDSIPPFSGDFNLMGGIYRDLWLITTSPFHFTGEYGSDGLQFITEEVTAGRARYKLRCSTSNGYSDPAGAAIRYQLELNGRVLRSGSRTISGGKSTSPELTDSLDNPQLWSPESPTLYQLTVQLFNAKNELQDELSRSIGFKSVSISDKKEFLLNGKPYKLKGASRHQDYDRLGNALTDAMHLRDIQLMREMGCNFIRIAHYPQDPAIYEACDRLGLIAWSEIPVVDKVVDNPVFLRNSENLMKEMVLQHYDHPAVAIWGYHNEVRNLDSASLKNAMRLNSIAKSLDPSRLTAMAIETNLSGAYFKSPLLPAMFSIPDIIGYNVYEGWYRGSIATVPAFIQTLHSLSPARPILFSEYGAGSSTNIHTSAPTVFDFSEEYQCLFQEPYLEEGGKFPWIIGWSVWNFIDFQRDGREDVQPNINNKGMVSTDRKPKDVFYYYKAKWSREPFVYIAGKNWKERFAFMPAVSKDTRAATDIVVYSNQRQLQLYVNGKAAGNIESGTGKFIFHVSLKEGINQLLCKTPDNQLADLLSLNYHFISLTGFSKTFPGTQLCFNTGQSHTFFQDPQSGETWLPDKKYTAGTWGYIDGEIYSHWPNNKSWDGIREGVQKPVALTNKEPVYQTFVEGLSAWKADLPPGNYRVSLLLCEPLTATQRNNIERIMNITLNGESWVTGLNIEKEAGLLTALTLDKEVTVKKTEGITVGFSALSGKTVLNGVRLQKL